jgi:aspartokinase-like uncharacterized kinase
MPKVVKLGGSLLALPEVLRQWLRVVAAGGGRIVVVPGGGPFADAVRMLQGKLGYDDRAAHRMALLAMEQCGLLFASLEPSLVPAASTAAIRSALRHGLVPVWMPSRAVANAEGIAESWDVTSDSLAVWLARELGAERLWLVKACPVPVQDPAQLAATGLVDAAFPRLCATAGLPVHVVGPGDASRLAACLMEPSLTPSDHGAP